MKTVGLLAYHQACNFGANLQIFSTYSFLLNHGFNPIVINYVPDSLAAFYARPIYSKKQSEMHHIFTSKMQTTRLCRNSKEVADVICENRIEGVIIGSDAVAQHHTFFSRIIFPSKRHIVSFDRASTDRLFPNAFWGEFLLYLEKPIITVIMSASNQQSDFHQFLPCTMKRMRQMLSKISYISVRDEWTQRMYNHIFKGKLNPEITPDPVFAFNYNVNIIPQKDDILRRFSLPDKYILLAVRNATTLTDDWMLEFERICKKHDYVCVAFPFPQGLKNNKVLQTRIDLPLSPIDWYALIKYSSGFVGNNMHTVISALHNSVPLFCFDQYGIKRLNYFDIPESSKIYDIMHRAGFDNNRVHCGKIHDTLPTPQHVFEVLMQFDKEKCKAFAEMYYQRYLGMMKQIIELMEN